MKIRERSMPAENLWKRFFDLEKILVTIGFDHSVANAVDFGCGYGTFSIPASKLIKGTMYAIDTGEEMIKRVTERANNENLKNVKIILCDFTLEDSGLENQSVDYAMLFNILNAEKPERLLNEA